MPPPAMTAVPTTQPSSTSATSATSVQLSTANSPSSSSSTSQRTSNTTQSNGDSLFEPTVEMMVNDFDDERTLEEEEALAASEDPSAELSNLERVRLIIFFIVSENIYLMMIEIISGTRYAN